MLFLVGAGAVLLVTVMVLYPGGNWLDRGARRHAFFRNFFCDFVADVAGNGEPGCPLGDRGMLLVFAALLPFWLLVLGPALGRARLSAAARSESPRRACCPSSR